MCSCPDYVGSADDLCPVCRKAYDEDQAAYYDELATFQPEYDEQQSEYESELQADEDFQTAEHQAFDAMGLLDSW